MRGLRALALALVASATSAGGDDVPFPGRRGPMTSREEWIPAQPVLTLPAASPDPLPVRRTEVRLDLDWGNDFGWEPLPGGRQQGLQFMVDGEHRSAAVSARHGVSRRVTVGLRVPLFWRGPGRLDGIIDPFHRWFGFPDAGRPLFPRHQLRVEARDDELQALPARFAAGTGLGATEVHGLLVLRHRESGLSVSVVGRVQLPSATGPFSRRAVDVGTQILAARPLARGLDAYGGAGLVWPGSREAGGLVYAFRRPSGFLAFEWRPARRLSLLVQGELAGALLEGVPQMPATQAYLRIGAKLSLGRYTVDGGFTEGIHGLSATTDFGLLAGVSRRF